MPGALDFLSRLSPIASIAQGNVPVSRAYLEGREAGRRAKRGSAVDRLSGIISQQPGADELTGAMADVDPIEALQMLAKRKKESDDEWHDAFGAGIIEADTPEKWAAMQQTLAQQFPDRAQKVRNLPFETRRQMLIRLNDLQPDLARQVLGLGPGGQGETFSTQPVFGEDAEGNPVLLQFGSKGTVQRAPLPGGVTAAEPLQTVDLGTSIQLRGRRTGRKAGEEEKDVRGEAREKAIGGEGVKIAFEEVATRRKAAQDARQSLTANAQARDLLKGGAITGSGAEFMTGFGKSLQQLGINLDRNAVANTEAFAASRAREVGRIIKLFGAGTGLSDADREFATKAAAGQITMSRKAIERILDINDFVARDLINTFNKDIDTFSTKLKDDTLLTFKVEAPGGGGSEFVDANGQPAVINGEPVTQEDIAQTAQEEGISEEEVMQRLGIRRGP